MGKKRWRVAFFTLSLALCLCLANLAWAAPNLLGTWTGTAPKITLLGCSNETITLTVARQCGNLFSGTLAVGTTSIPVVGRFFPKDNSLTLTGNVQKIDPPNFSMDMVTLSGVYIAANPPSITVNTFTHTTEDMESFNTEYDVFSMVKQ